MHTLPALCLITLSSSAVMPDGVPASGNFSFWDLGLKFSIEVEMREQLIKVSTQVIKTEAEDITKRRPSTIV
jgi:hypothetical protein